MPELKVGDKVFLAVGGNIREGTVEKVFKSTAVTQVRVAYEESVILDESSVRLCHVEKKPRSKPHAG